MRCALLPPLAAAAALVCPLAALGARGAGRPASEGEALFKYVSRPEPRWGWRVAGKFSLGGVRVYDIALTSQVWRGIEWKHTLRAVIPANVKYRDTALLFITGGEPKGSDLGMAATIANLTSAPFLILYNIPNQPLFGGLTEDRLIAHTFIKFLETGDETWPLLFPMVKGAVKAMDAFQEFARGSLGWAVKGFVVTGASKRGWTTWLTAAVDKRVKGIAPMVFDILNFEAQLPHQIEMWGDYSEQISPYTKSGLVGKLSTARGRRLARMVDPYFYRDRFTMPKLIILGTNDRYWTIDALNLYWDALPGEKWALYVPNSGHGLEDRRRVVSSLAAFFRYVAGGAGFPRLRWEHKSAGGKALLSLTASPPPERARLWVARSKTLDFRESKWEPIPMRKERGRFVGEVALPRDENLALFGEAEFAMGPLRFTLSTTVRVIRPRR